MVVEAEGDVIGSYFDARQPDTPLFRSWEIAGTAHADSYTVNVGFGDIGDGAGASQMFDLMRNPLNLGCGSPINAGPHYLILQAAFAGTRQLGAHRSAARVFPVARCRIDGPDRVGP